MICHIYDIVDGKNGWYARQADRDVFDDSENLHLKPFCFRCDCKRTGQIMHTKNKLTLVLSVMPR